MVAVLGEMFDPVTELIELQKDSVVTLFRLKVPRTDLTGQAENVWDEGQTSVEILGGIPKKNPNLL